MIAAQSSWGASLSQPDAHRGHEPMPSFVVSSRRNVILPLLAGEGRGEGESHWHALPTEVAAQRWPIGRWRCHRKPVGVSKRISAYFGACKRIKAKNLHAKMSQKPSFLLGKFAKTGPKNPSKNVQISRTNQACQAVLFPLAHGGPLANGGRPQGPLPSNNSSFFIPPSLHFPFQNDENI
jgi:hypothetical protein